MSLPQKYLAAAFFLVCGCATQPIRHYEVGGISIYVAEESIIWEKWAEYRDAMPYGWEYQYVRRPNGFCNISKKEIWIRYWSDKPDMECLGHEVFHLMVGDWHSKNTTNEPKQ